MELVAQDPSEYLGVGDVIDFGDHSVSTLASRLRSGCTDDREFARGAFEYVRDAIHHSWDVQDPRVTLSATEVLRHGVGLCFAKSHLLTALLRCEGIPTGLCYQRLTDDGQRPVLHGLIAMYLEGAWHRQDPRGNKTGIDAQFSVENERLAWPVHTELGERDYPQVFVEPSNVVTTSLRAASDVLELCEGGLPSDL